MALFSYFNNSRTPEQKLKDAVKSNNITDLRAVLQSGVNPNIKLQRHGGNTALHFAASDGLTDIVDELLGSGADCNLCNDHGNIPLVDACLKNHTEVFQKLLLVTSKHDFLSLRAIDYASWTALSPEMMLMMIRASPSVQAFCQHVFVLTLPCWRALILCGKNTNDSDVKGFFKTVLGECEAAKNTNNPEEEQINTEDSHNVIETQRKASFFSWFKRFQSNPQSLKHFCRLSIRRSFQGKCNVFYGTSTLGLPQILLDYICLLH